ncbi:MAG: cytidine deaminase [Chitinophagaceae bacterium]|nr:cytidine deaminase [Chitinophagaceae bacterium]
MKTGIINFSYQAFNSAAELPVHYRTLLEKARAATVNAYAPYSLFFVGAAAMFENGETITATNQENASSPVGICAERVLLSAASSVYPGTGITTIAISYSNQKTGWSRQPVFPCGICRQSLLEQQIRQNTPIQLVLGGLEGQVFVINNAADLLPFAFTGKDME